jgi:hypothetical protein
MPAMAWHKDRTALHAEERKKGRRDHGEPALRVGWRGPAAWSGPAVWARLRSGLGRSLAQGRPRNGISRRWGRGI